MACRTLPARKEVETNARKFPASLSVDAIGVTLVSPKHAHLADEAAAHFQHHAGLPVSVLRTSDEQAFGAKLALDLLCPWRKIVFFDADLWLIRKAEFGPWLHSGHFCAVQDPCANEPNNFVGKDTVNSGWAPGTYFNSGLFCCDLALPHIRRVFSDARQRLEETRAGQHPQPIDSTDQYYLNWAVKNQSGLFKAMPREFNYFHIATLHGAVFQIPANMIGLHAAGYKAEKKLETLKAQAAIFGPQST